jgi:predicted nucleic acid-binding protein
VKDGFVADSSVGVAWAIYSQANEGTTRLLNQIAEGRPFFVPVLWTFELSNTLLSLLRRRRIRRDEYEIARATLNLLPAQIDDEGPRFGFTKILDLAAKHELSTYDAAYLELAIRRGLPLASRDAALNKAAQKSGVALAL